MGQGHRNDMNDSPPLENESPPTAGLRFARWAAICSLALPFVATLVCVLLFGLTRFVGQTRLAVIVGLVLLMLILLVAGVGLGVAGLVVPRRHERKGIFGKALIGLSINLLLLAAVVAVPLWAELALRKEKFPRTPQARLERATNRLATAASDEKRFYALDDAAKQSFETGHVEEARKYANELLTLVPHFVNNWNYGNAIQDGNLVLGRIALREGRVDEAKKRLLETGSGPGSPQMNSFGPNMSLARDLLQKGERDTVLQYFELCRKFWKMDFGKLDGWSGEVKAGKLPDFGANLVY
jgi:hypothetical protein